jgi:hypothetical protein
MSSKKTIKEKITSSDVINVISSNPAKAFEQLVTSGLYSKQGFWNDFKGIDLNELQASQTDITQIYFLHRINGLRFFFDLKKRYEVFAKEQTGRVIALNPKPIDVLKILFLSLDLAEIGAPHLDVKYSNEAIKAIPKIYRVISTQKQEGKFSEYSIDMFNTVNQLLRIETDINRIDGFLDLYLMDDLLLLPKEEGKGYELRFISDEVKKNSLFIAEDLKSTIKRNFTRDASQVDISTQEHFAKNDEQWKTNEGFIAVYHSENMKVVSAGGKGFTSKQIDREILKALVSSDPVEQQEAQQKMMAMMLEGNFHHKHRHVLAEIYQPGDEINIHSLHIELSEGKFITLYELLAAVCSFAAISDNIRYISEIDGLPALHRWVKSITRNAHPNYTEVELELACAANIANHLPLLEQRKEFTTFFTLSKSTLIGVLRKVEELKDKSEGELESIIDLLVSHDAGLPYNFLFKTGNQFFLAYQVCNRFNVAKDFYDFYITARLFNNNVGKSKKEYEEIGNNHKGREIQFNLSLRNLFSKLTPYVKKSVNYGNPNSESNFGELKGEIDVLAYFEKENLLIPIQVKLSNRTPWDEKRKTQWVEEKLFQSAAHQVNKDMQLLKNEAGLKFAASQLGFNRIIDADSLTIYPAVVTDNFFADHEDIPYGSENDSVLVVSYFEIMNLINQQKVHEKQGDWEAIKSGEQLVVLLEDNVFWNFIKEFVSDYKVTKSLVAIEAVDSICLKI